MHMPPPSHPGAQWRPQPGLRSIPRRHRIPPRLRTPRHGGQIPTGLNHPAQGCPLRATLKTASRTRINPERVESSGERRGDSHRRRDSRLHRCGGDATPLGLMILWGRTQVACASQPWADLWTPLAFVEAGIADMDGLRNILARHSLLSLFVSKLNQRFGNERWCLPLGEGRESVRVPC